MAELTSSLRSLAEALRVPHTGADGQKYAEILRASRDDESGRADSARRSAEQLAHASGDAPAFMSAFDGLAARGPRVANVVGKILGVAERVSKDKALRALVTTATHSLPKPRVAAEARPASGAPSTSSSLTAASDPAKASASVRSRRAQRVTSSTTSAGNENASSANADISEATSSREPRRADKLKIDVDGGDIGKGSNITNGIMSPSTWGKLQGISVSAKGRSGGIVAASSTLRSEVPVSGMESPSALMAELNKVNLGRAPRQLNARKTSPVRSHVGDGMSPAALRNAGTSQGRIYHDKANSKSPAGGGRLGSIDRYSQQPTYSSSTGTLANDDENSPVALRFGQTIILRSASSVGGGFLNSQGRGAPMVLSEGCPTELILTNGNFRDDVGTVRYGDIVSFQIRGGSGGVVAASAKDGAACVATALGGTEKWTLVSPEEAAKVAAGTTSSFSSGSYSSLSALRSSDPILLRANSLGGRYLDSRLELVERAPLASQSWYLVHSHTPYVPAWNRTRPYLCGHYMDRGFSEAAVARLPDDSPAKARWLEQRPSPLRSYPAPLQENFLIEDLLSAMLGIGGRYIRASSMNDSLFALDPELSKGADKSVSFLATRILPIAGHYVRVSTFIETRSQYQYGLTVHALCAAMRSLVAEHTILVAQLEHQFRQGQLSLQKLFFYVQPATRTLAALDDVVHALGQRTGGSLLNVLDSLRNEAGGDRRVHALYTFLLGKAAVPTFEMLTRWVHHGDVDDRYGEFMIAVNETQSRADLVADFNTKYWAQRYTVRGEMVPIFLQRAAEKILTTGKYLNVLRGCGVAGEARLKASRRRMTSYYTGLDTNAVGDNGSGGSYDFGGNKSIDASGTLLDEVVAAEEKDMSNSVAVKGKQSSASSSFAQPLRYEAGERANIDAIERASRFASKALLDLLLTDNQLLLRLRSLKHYFLVDQGDFFVHFMDAAEDELRRSTSEISHARLELLLDTSIRQSISDGDTFNSDLKCSLLPYTLIQHLELVQQLSGEDGASGALSSSRIQGMDSIEDTRRKLLLVRHNQQLKGMEAFALDYEVKWPLSIVVSRKELTKYQLVFRHLFFCNHVKRQLSKTWLSHQTLKELGLHQMLAPTYCLRHRMLHFMQNLLYYMMVEVLEPRHHELEKNIGNAATVDEVLEHHSEFLDTCLKECLLSNHELIKLLTKIMTVCLLFSEQIEHFTESNRVDEFSSSPRSQGSAHVQSSSAKQRKNALELRRARLEVQSEQIKQIVSKPEYIRMIGRFSNNFDTTLGTFMKRLVDISRRGGEYQSHVSNLVTRLDFNMFYSNYLAL